MFGIRNVAIRFLLLAVTILVACNGSKKVATQEIGETAEQLDIFKNEKAANKIVFLTFDITEVDSAKEEYSLKLVNKIFAEGTLKKSSYSSVEEIEKNYLYCELIGADGKRIEMIKTEDPLRTVYEFPGDGGSFGKTEIKKRKGQFTIRFQNSSDIKYLSVFKAGDQLKKIYYAAL